MLEIQQKIISLKNIRKRFGDNEVLKGIDFEAMQGEIIAIIGSSGSGKSTLLRCVNLLEEPSDGEVVFQGKWACRAQNGVVDYNSADSIRALRTNLAMVFQQFNLWQHMTILQNVMEAPVTVQGRPKDVVRQEALAMLDKVGIQDKADSYVSQLSGGQQQRAAIARALAVQPVAMLFDEPTSALDPELEQEVLKVIRDLATEGRTMMLVTHDMDFARDVANRVIFLNEGVIEEEGTPQEIFERPRSHRLQQFLRASSA